MITYTGIPQIPGLGIWSSPKLPGKSRDFTIIGGPPLEYWGGGGRHFFNKYFCGKTREMNKWPQGLVGIQPILR